MEKLLFKENDKEYLDSVLLSHYIGERMFATFLGNELRSGASCVENGKISGVDKELLFAQVSWLKSGGIINEISSLNVDQIANLIKYEIKRYEQIIKSKGRLASANGMDMISYLSYLRDILHKEIGIGFAMDILPVSENIRDGFSIHKRTFLDVKIDSAFLGRVLGLIERTEFATNIEDIKDLIFDILAICREKFDSAICGIVFNNGKCISVCKQGFELLLSQYEKRMAYNKQRLSTGKLGYSFSFAQYSGLKANDITISHNKVGHSGVGSFIKSPFHSSLNNSLNSSDFRVFWGSLVEISNEDVVLNNTIGMLLANSLSVKGDDIMQLLNGENISKII